MTGVVGAKLCIGGLDQVRGVLDQELELLRQPPPDDRVVLLKPHLERLARHQLLGDEVGDHAAYSPGSGLAKPLPAPGLDQPPHVPFGDRHRLDRAGLLPIAIEPGIGPKQDRAGREEMDEGLPEDVHANTLRRRYARRCG